MKTTEELTLRTELRIGNSGRFARAEDIADKAAPGSMLSTPDGVGLLWIPKGSDPDTGLFGVRVPFDATTGTAIIGSVTSDEIVLLAQIAIEIPFSHGSSVDFGTVLDPSFFISCPGDARGCFQNPLIDTIETADFLLLTVSTTGSVGSGYIYYTVQK